MQTLPDRFPEGTSRWTDLHHGAGPVAHGAPGKAFTLIEPLVAIGVIAIPAGLLLPAPSAANGLAHGTCCMDNMKPLQSCWQLHGNDNESGFPRNPTSNSANDLDVGEQTGKWPARVTGSAAANRMVSPTCPANGSAFFRPKYSLDRRASC